ncbi:hypothetical protein F511_04846 [Dorcoceras hygrometricum]|uniref:Uncharacterized protein n=1 Tax=Dorcoceras hygrometricum TaxID=472368 RepID=A0A2Z7AVA8_9LAMI|nr:hypothetical protein F511_04846 [Dorcoceras hygrometricum]
MGDRATLEKARKELEDFYLGVPDDSVNLTFQDLAQVRQQHAADKLKTIEPISESISKRELDKLPSLDFNKGLEASFQSTGNHHHHHNSLHGDHHVIHRSNDSDFRGQHQYHHGGLSLHSGDHGVGSFQRSVVYDDDMSHVSGMSVAYGAERGGGRRRPGIPHSKICTVCCNYIYIFRHRCLVCGRVYCRQCVSIGMGEMSEGRKCIECLGRRFSQRYIREAGRLGCCMGYPSLVKQQELKWAERGPRRSGENRYTHSVMVSRSRSPVTPRTPNRPHSPTCHDHHSFPLTPRTPTRPHSPHNPPSFVASSSPYSPAHHHPLPF